VFSAAIAEARVAARGLMNSNSAILRIQGDVADERLAAITRDVLATLRRDDRVTAEPVKQASQVGDRSAEVVSLGQIALTFITAGAATALIEAVRSTLARERKVSISIETPNGHKVTTSVIDFGGNAVGHTEGAIQRLVETVLASGPHVTQSDSDRKQ
jgi:hypothetical protein